MGVRIIGVYSQFNKILPSIFTCIHTSLQTIAMPVLREVALGQYLEIQCQSLYHCNSPEFAVRRFDYRRELQRV